MGRVLSKRRDGSAGGGLAALYQRLGGELRLSTAVSESASCTGTGNVHVVTTAAGTSCSTLWSRTRICTTPTVVCIRERAGAETQRARWSGCTGRCRVRDLFRDAATVPEQRPPHGAVRAALSRDAARDLPTVRPAGGLQPVPAPAHGERSQLGWPRWDASPSSPGGRCRTRVRGDRLGAHGRGHADRSLAELERILPTGREIVTSASSRRGFSRDQLNAFQGSAFSVAPRLAQARIFVRTTVTPSPGAVHRRRRPHPGAGVPVSSTRRRRPFAWCSRICCRRDRRWRHDVP